MKIQVNQIVENVLPNNKGVIVCRVVELNVAGTNMVRLTEACETRDNAWLIKNDRTWAAPLENIRYHDENCIECHKEGLIYFSK